jgi:hypothetical protein
LPVVDLKLQRQATKLRTNVEKFPIHHHSGPSCRIRGLPTACAYSHKDSGALSSDEL